MSATPRTTAPSAIPEAPSTTCSYVLGEDGLASWSDVHADAWIGLLETHKRLTRALDAELEAEHGLTLSALEVLARLGAAENHSLGLSALAGACGLSLSRISRVIDALEARGLVERRAVPSDARAVEARLRPEGLDLVRRAQATHFASVQTRFFEHLSEEEIAQLATIFSRFAPRSPEACTVSSP
jgi:DNA-binding MarR family transcriptional regulator